MVILAYLSVWNTYIIIISVQLCVLMICRKQGKEGVWNNHKTNIQITKYFVNRVQELFISIINIYYISL